MALSERHQQIIGHFVQHSEIPSFATKERIEEMLGTMRWGPHNKDLRAALDLRHRELSSKEQTKRAGA